MLEITVENFLSFKKKETWKTKKNINLFFGINGAGKSNFLEIFGFLKGLDSDDSKYNYIDYINQESHIAFKDILIEIKNHAPRKILYDFFEELYQSYDEIGSDLIQETKDSIEIINGSHEVDKAIEFLWEIQNKILSNIVELSNKIYFFSLKTKLKQNNQYEKTIIFLDENLKNIDINVDITNEINSNNSKKLSDLGEAKNPFIKVVKKLNKQILSFKTKIRNNAIKQSIKFWKYEEKLTFPDEIIFELFGDIENQNNAISNIIKKFYFEKLNYSLKSTTNLRQIMPTKSLKKIFSKKLTNYANEILKDRWPSFFKSKLIEFEIEEKNLSKLKISTSIIEKYNGEKILEFSKESSGTKLFLSYLFTFFLDLDKNSIIIVDEPETHLHIGTLQKLFELFIFKSKNNTFLITTHSPLLFNNFPKEKEIQNNLIEYDNKDSTTKIQNLNESEFFEL